MARGNSKIYWLKFVLGLLLVVSYLTVSITNQIRYTFIPFARNYRYIPQMLLKDDLGQLKELAFGVYRMINEINQYPQNTNFYFVPGFSDSKNSEIWWWYLYLLSRYLCYPRKLFCHDEVLYYGEKAKFIEKFIGRAGRYNELDWIKRRNIEYIILFRKNSVSVLPVTAEIVL